MIPRELAAVLDQARGFDTNTTLTPATARAFHAKGYRFAIRYLRRATPHPYDLTSGEVDVILGAGLGLMAVQHVESAESWLPSGNKGDANGGAAVAHARELALPIGATLWCDLEGVAPGTSEAAVIAYVNGWCDVVGTAGFLPGLYVGWHPGLGPEALFHELHTRHYWASYNLDTDQYPVVRGVQMRQWARLSADVPNGLAIPFDVDTVLTDKLGGLPLMVIAGGGEGGESEGEL